MNIRLLAVKRDGTQGMLEIELPFILSASASDEKFEMYYLHDANGTDHYFNKNDGTYDGWGKAICNDDVTPEEVEGIKCGLGDVRAGRVKSLEQINREIGNTPPLAPGEQPPFPPKITVSTGVAPGCTAQALERMGKWIEFDAPSPQERASDILEHMKLFANSPAATLACRQRVKDYADRLEPALATAAKQARHDAFKEAAEYADSCDSSVGPGEFVVVFYGWAKRALAAQPSPQTKEDVK